MTRYTPEQLARVCRLLGLTRELPPRELTVLAALVIDLDAAPSS